MRALDGTEDGEVWDEMDLTTIDGSGRVLARDLCM